MRGQAGYVSLNVWPLLAAAVILGVVIGGLGGGLLYWLF